MKLNNAKILVIAAHPDDDILGCGGTLAKAKSMNTKVKILFLGEGVSARLVLVKKILKIIEKLKSEKNRM